ncbi:MAG: hypothetical protein ACTSRA_07615 [Promethearchaeota archaeon]
MSFLKNDLPLIGGYNSLFFENESGKQETIPLIKDSIFNDDLLVEVKNSNKKKSGKLFVLAFELDGGWAKKLLISEFFSIFFKSIITLFSKVPISDENGEFHGPCGIYNYEIGEMIDRLKQKYQSNTVEKIRKIILNQKGKGSRFFKKELSWFMSDLCYEHLDLDNALKFSLIYQSAQKLIKDKINAKIGDARSIKINLLKQLMSQTSLNLKQFKRQIKIIEKLFSAYRFLNNKDLQIVQRTDEFLIFFNFIIDFLNIFESNVNSSFFYSKLRSRGHILTGQGQNQSFQKERLILDIKLLLDEYKPFVKKYETLGFFPFLYYYLCMIVFSPNERPQYLTFRFDENHINYLLEYEQVLFRILFRRYKVLPDLIQKIQSNDSEKTKAPISPLLDSLRVRNHEFSNQTNLLLYDYKHGILETVEISKVDECYINVLEYFCFSNRNPSKFTEIITCCIMALMRYKSITKGELSRMAKQFGIRGYTKSSLKEKFRDFRILEIKRNKIIFPSEKLQFFNKLLESANADKFCKRFFISKFLKKIAEEYNKIDINN